MRRATLTNGVRTQDFPGCNIRNGRGVSHRGDWHSVYDFGFVFGVGVCDAAPVDFACALTVPLRNTQKMVIAFTCAKEY